MGCFSGLCKECGKGVKSTSFSGEQAKLFLLKDGKVLQMMEGQYNSYGGVFIENTQRKDVKHELMESVHWNDPYPDDPMDQERVTRDGTDEYQIWNRVCNLDFDDDTSNGIAYVHTSCFKEVPTTRSERDPNQGWGNPDEGEEDLMGIVDPDYEFDEDKDD